MPRRVQISRRKSLPQRPRSAPAAAPRRSPRRRVRPCPGACRRAGRRHRCGQVPPGAAGPSGDRPRRRATGRHRRRQHRGRHHPARAARLPRPRHRHVHPRRRHPPGAGLGPGSRDVRGLGRARGLRRPDPSWFALGDRDLATHLVRTQLLAGGASLSAATAVLCERWRPGVRLLPMSDDPVQTHVSIADPDAPGGTRTVHFQEYWVRLRAGPDALAVVPVGADKAAPAPGVLEAIARGRRDPAAAVQPGGQHRHDPGRAGHPRRPCATPPPPSSACPPSSAAPPCAAWPTRCSPRSASRPPPPRSPSTTGPACSTAGSSTRATPTPSPRSRRPASAPGPSRCSCATWPRPPRWPARRWPWPRSSS